MEQSLIVEFDELFALRDRLRQVADTVRARFLAAGFMDPMETEVFDQELELRGTGDSRLLIRLDGFHLEIAGAPPELHLHRMAAILLEEAGAFRLNLVDAGFTLTAKVRRGNALDLVHKAFTPVDVTGGQEPMLDRRFSMTWDWGNATTGYSFLVTDTEDKELLLSFKVREGYMTLPDLAAGHWMAREAARFDQLVGRFFQQLGWA